MLLFARSTTFWRTTRGLSVAALVLACGDAVRPVAFNVDLSVEDDTVWVNRSPNEVRARVQVVVRNQDTRALYVTPCAHVVQRETDGRWTSVWVSPCPPTRLYSLELVPGESTGLTLEARAELDASEWPATAQPGSYRVILSLTSTPLNTGGIVPTLVENSARTTLPFPVRVRTIVF